MTRHAALAATLTFVLVACGQSVPATSPDTGVGSVVTTNPDPTTPTSEVPESGRGWIDGEPDWYATQMTEDGAGCVSCSSPTAAESSDAVMSPVPTGEPASTAPGGEMPGEPDTQGPLRAGSVDDNADFAGFLTYLERIKQLGVPTREFDPSGRIVVTVTATSGLPVAGIPVQVVGANNATPLSELAVIATLRTTADGTVRFLPALYDAADIDTFQFTADGVTGTAAPGGNVTLSVDAPGGAQAPVALDVLFLLDATGSMGDEIDQLKTTIDEVASRVAAFETQPDVRFAFTLYRDEGDAFVTTTFDFTGDVDEFSDALANVVADGGGDYPEALEEGFADALSSPSWRDPASTVQLMFLVGDAPPRLDRQVQTDYPAAIVEAVSRGIKVFPIASSESDDQAEVVFRSIAAATGARFVFLSYGAAGAATGESTDIAPTDYEEMSLDELVVRFIAEELAALTGTDQGVPPATTQPVTNPPGQ